jgi:hypothetical protein
MPPRRSALQTRAVAQLSSLRRAFQRQSGWQRLVPDFSSTFITAGRGTKGNATDDYFPGDTGGSYVTGSRTPDGRLAVIYLPDATQRITIDQSKMGPGYTARWVDPTNGNTIGATEGATYSRNAPHADGADDWLLVLTATRSR